jgi:hypothetical protein
VDLRGAARLRPEPANRRGPQRWHCGPSAESLALDIPRQCVTDAAILAEVFSASELSQLKASCKSQILAGGASQAFVVSSSVAGRSVTLQQTYNAWDMLGLIETALAVVAGDIGNSRMSKAQYGVY